jgi:hypothetical protein
MEDTNPVEDTKPVEKTKTAPAGDEGDEISLLDLLIVIANKRFGFGSTT